MQRVKLLFDQLQKESMRVGQSVYEKAQAQTPADGVPQEGDNNDNGSDSGTEYIPPEDSK
jgi:molecular chaperone DnaK